MVGSFVDLDKSQDFYVCFFKCKKTDIRGGHGNPLQDSWMENPHGQRSLDGYRPWGRKESGTAE